MTVNSHENFLSNNNRRNILYIGNSYYFRYPMINFRGTNLEIMTTACDENTLTTAKTVIITNINFRVGFTYQLTLLTSNQADLSAASGSSNSANAAARNMRVYVNNILKATIESRTCEEEGIELPVSFGHPFDASVPTANVTIQGFSLEEVGF